MTQEIYLQPGEFYFGGGDVLVTTLLGSCVAIVMWHAVRRLGGMCHFMLPSRSMVIAGQWDGRYADEAMALFSGKLRQHKTAPREYRVAVFGGGDMFPSIKGSGLDVGPRNVRAARKLLPQHGFSIEREDLGGIGHRRVWFDLNTGELTCVRLGSQTAPNPGIKTT